jgi:hypothetical protein
MNLNQVWKRFGFFSTRGTAIAGDFGVLMPSSSSISLTPSFAMSLAMSVTQANTAENARMSFGASTVTKRCHAPPNASRMMLNHPPSNRRLRPTAA